MKKKLYIKTTLDEYSLPIAVAESPTELAKMLGIKANAVSHALSVGAKSYCTVLVECEEDEEV